MKLLYSPFLEGETLADRSSALIADSDVIGNAHCPFLQSARGLARGHN